MKDYVASAIILGIKMSLLTLRSAIYEKTLNDRSKNAVLHLEEIAKILEDLIDNEKPKS